MVQYPLLALVCLIFFVIGVGGCAGASAFSENRGRFASLAGMPGNLKVGWAQADITPSEPVLIVGQFYARVSEGVLDPLTTTALALETPDDQTVLVSCDLVAIPDTLRDAIRARLTGVRGLDPMKVVLNATHTHAGPGARLSLPSSAGVGSEPESGVELDAMNGDQYAPFAAERIATAVRQAWVARQPGAVAFGQGWAVLGRNRRSVNLDGTVTMYGRTDKPAFSHIEGYEDHGVGLLATYDAAGKLTGLVVNVACPAQVTSNLFVLSADYWHETRVELRRRLGKDLFVLPQCSAAGDQSPHPLYEKRAVRRMLELHGRTERQEIALKIAAVFEDVLPAIASTADASPVLRHHVETIDLPMNALAEEDVKTALAGAEQIRPLYEEERRKLEEDPSLKHQPRWYKDVTFHYRRMRWFGRVAERFETQKEKPTQPAEVHVLRLGDLGVVTNPFELYLDFGIRIKARSPAVQTMLVQLAGGGTYVPSPRSVAGGGYGSVPASNSIGPEGGRILTERTLAILDEIWSPQAESLDVAK